ncbi:hypothetical protein LIA77_04428 [Sarocladium implicatum]|nr:hypothetical protein LIA77_04428 [Sarocladium implicatum]
MMHLGKAILLSIPVGCQRVQSFRIRPAGGFTGSCLFGHRHDFALRTSRDRAPHALRRRAPEGGWMSVYFFE